jgi:hypothetical protein
MVGWYQTMCYGVQRHHPKFDTQEESSDLDQNPDKIDYFDVFNLEI